MRFDRKYGLLFSQRDVDVAAKYKWLIVAVPLLLVVGILLLGCAGSNYVEVGIGPEIAGEWDGRGGVVDIAVGREGELSYCEYRHTSNLLSGPPFNHEHESRVDRLTCGLRVGF